MEPAFIITGVAALAATGIIGEFLAVMLGIGGGIVVVPMLYTMLVALGMAPDAASRLQSRHRWRQSQPLRFPPFSVTTSAAP